MKGRRVVWPERGKVVVEDFEIPEIQPDQILLRTEFSLISPGTERASLLSLPLVKGGFPKGGAGYTASGTVLETGSAVTSLQPGDRVTCSSGHATHAAVSHERALPVPDSVPLEDAAWVNLATMALLGPRLARIELGEPVLVIGLGPMGQLAAQMARLQGAVPVVAADIEDFRLDIAGKCGALPLKANTPNFCDELLALTNGKGPAVVMEVTGHPQPIVDALEAAAPGGRVILLATPRGITESVDFCNTVHRSSLTVVGAYASRRPGRSFSAAGIWPWRDDAEVILRLLESNLLDVAGLVTHTMGIESAPEAYQMVVDWRPDVVGILLDHRG